MFEKVKRILPVSSRSFYARANDLDARLDALSEKINELTIIVNRNQNELELLNGRCRSQNAIYLISEPGYPNYGDELIVSEWLRYFAQTCPWRPVFIDCARAGSAAALLDGIHPHLVVVDTVARITLENDYVNDPEKNAAWLNSSLDDEGKAARYAAGIGIVRERADIIHLTGGGYINSMWRPNLARLGIAEWAHARGRRVLSTGLGLLPLNDNDVHYVNQRASFFDMFGVRDLETFNVVSGGNCHLMPDDCFVNGLDGCYSLEERLPEIMVCIQGDFISDQAALFSHVNRILQEWRVGEEEAIGVVECMPYSDYPIFSYLMEKGWRCRFFPLAYLLNEGFPARAGQKWISTRYHPHLLAAACGCSGVFISPNEKYYQIKHNAVLRMGSQWSNSVIGAAIPEPGRGFGDSGLRYAHQDAIREAVAPFYN